MPLKLVLGPANAAKAGEVLSAYAAAARRGAVLVVPTALDAEHYSRELAAQGSVVGSVLTFPGLVGEIARRARYDGARLSPLQRDRVLRRVVASLPLQAIGRSARAPGFVSAAGDLIAELQRSLVTPQRFTQALEAWAAEDARRRPYGRDLASLYRAYAGELQRIGRVDAELFAWRALDALRAQPGLWGPDPVFVYGFDDLTALERDAIETLARVVGIDVTVSLTFEPGRAALSARAEVVEELRALAQHVDVLPPRDEHYEPHARDALHHLERGLFEPAERIDPGDTVRLLEAGGELIEAELVAAEVLELLRSGVPGDEIVVVWRSLTRVAPLVQRVFSRYGIPLSSAHRLRFAHTALGHSVRALARCALLPEDEARPEDLLDYLRSPGMLERVELADALEADARRDGLRTAAQARDRLGWALEEIDALAACAQRELPAALVAHARRLFAAPRRGSAPVLGPAEEADATALAALAGAAAELQELGEELTAAELLELLDGLELPAAMPAAPGAVLLAEPLAIRARRFRAVFVGGLVEGEFPLPAVSEPFLSDEHRRELAIASGLVLPRSDGALDRERYLLYACVSRATERITFSYRSSDEEGNLVLPSPFLSDLAELFAPDWPERRRRRLLADVVWPAAEAPTARELDRARAAAEAPSAGAVPEPVRSLDAVALSHVRHRDVLSGGALESFAACPVKWLVERQLAPAALEPDPDPLVRGSYMHAALEEIIGRLAGPVTFATLPDALELLEEVVAELPSRLAAGRPEAVKAASLRAIEADLRRYLHHEAAAGCGWRPQGLELRFGFEGDPGSVPALTLRSGSEEVTVRGVIDRVDVDPVHGGRAIIRDYKSGSARPEHQGARWQTDGQLQVALYMLTVRRLLGLEPVAGLYQPLGGGDLRPRGVFVKGAEIGSGVVANDGRDPEELDEVLADAEARAVELGMRLRSGQLTPCPETCSREGCRYPGICRSQ